MTNPPEITEPADVYRNQHSTTRFLIILVTSNPTTSPGDSRIVMLYGGFRLTSLHSLELFLQLGRARSWLFILHTGSSSYCRVTTITAKRSVACRSLGHCHSALQTERVLFKRQSPRHSSRLRSSLSYTSCEWSTLF